jgi:hypothetical protein
VNKWGTHVGIHAEPEFYTFIYMSGLECSYVKKEVFHKANITVLHCPLTVCLPFVL